MKEPLPELEERLANAQLSDAFAIISECLLQFGNSARIAICAMYFFLDVLLYARYATDHERLQAEERLKEIYSASNVKFESDPEYLFFAGYLSAISYWLFGQDSIEPSRKKLSRAIQLDPGNPVYRWAYGLLNNDIGHRKLAREIMNEPAVIKQVRSYGAAGIYVAEAIGEDRGEESL